MKWTCVDCAGDVDVVPTCPTCNGSGLVDVPPIPRGCAWVALVILLIAAAGGIWLLHTLVNWLAAHAVGPA